MRRPWQASVAGGHGAASARQCGRADDALVEFRASRARGRLPGSYSSMSTVLLELVGTRTEVPSLHPDATRGAR